MKNIKQILILCFLGGMIALASCEEQRILFEGPAHVRFTDTTLTYKESVGQPIQLKVHIVGKPVNQATTVNYTISGDAREGRDYVIEGTKGTVTIPANESFGTITVRLINNANNILGSQDILFTLTGVSNDQLQVGFGQNNNIGRQLRLTIQDDCLFSGFYTGSRGGTSLTVPNIEIMGLGQNCREYLITNWNIDLADALFGLNAVKPTLTIVDNGDNTLTIPIQVNAELPSPYDTLSGNGVWNPQTKAILLNLRLKLPYSQTKDTVITVPFTFTPR
ncbi:Calx-beta domain-containing protein [Telluribacter humicola]|uniref:Calx-beta domain-containing protein n=1 Tax=Telluribacter humicola TaxID=1720261 RepID=UPI001A96B8DA|nr:Calx-beta domain-containing protein [Telluribacter humicola]